MPDASPTSRSGAARASVPSPTDAAERASADGSAGRRAAEPELAEPDLAEPDLAQDELAVHGLAEHGLVDHLRAAIRQNVARRGDYRRRGGWRAWALSVVLVGHERALLPAAALLDRQARRFWREGLPVLAADLEPLARSPPPGRRLDGVRAVPRRALRWLAGFAWASTRELGALLRRRGFRADRFRDVARAVGAALDALALLEDRFGARCALTAHVLESIGVTAVNGLAYAERSGGRTAALSRRFAAGQVLLLPGAVLLDALAGPVHARGVPLFVDDVPPVPFRAALRPLDRLSRPPE